MEWISVKKKKPKADIRVLVFSAEGICTATYSDEYEEDYWKIDPTGFETSDASLSRVSYWQHLPESPEEK